MYLAKPPVAPLEYIAEGYLCKLYMLITVKYRGFIRFYNAYHAKIQASGNLFTHVFGKRGRTESRTGGSTGEGSQRLQRSAPLHALPFLLCISHFFPAKFYFWTMVSYWYLCEFFSSTPCLLSPRSQVLDASHFAPINTLVTLFKLQSPSNLMDHY